MNKVKTIAKRTGAALSVAAFTAVSYMNGSAFATTTSAQNAQNGVAGLAGRTNSEQNLTAMIGTILNIVYGVIGIVTVIMIILGGVNYATSQGDSTKVKKAKDTIMYGIIGLVIVLLAFAITNFVLSGITGNATGTDPAAPAAPAAPAGP